MREHVDLIDAYAASAEGESLALATVVRVRGSAYRRPGARMLLAGGRWLAGAVSGGCLESDVATKALWRTENGPALVTYDATLDDDDVTWGFGLGCNGVVDVLLERMGDSAACPLRALERSVRDRKHVTVATVLSSAALGQRTCSVEGEAAVSTVSDPLLHEAVSMAIQRLRRQPGVHHAELCGHPVMIEVIEPPLPFVIFGAGYDAVPLVHTARRLGWHTTVVDTGSRPGTAARFAHADSVIGLDAARAGEVVGPASIAVIMTHNFDADQALLGSLLRTPVRYIGVLGPKARSDRMLASLREQGFAPDGLARLHAPVGLDIGAEGADAIAIAIVAEITAALNGRSGAMLRLRDAPIHVARR